MTDALNRYIEPINRRLAQLMELQQTHPSLKEAMAYSVSAGGKRLRPTLNIMGTRLLGGSVDETMDIACAMEMIHTYSLVHDDLPAMDDDELRRGKPTNHVMFGEAFAILAGDGLLNYAFEVMLENALRHQQNIAAHVQAMQEVAIGAGVRGMITGQCADIENEGQILTERELVYVHRHKTGDLIKSSLLSGLLLCSPDQKSIDALTLYGYNVGLTFQIIDDILDVTSDEKTLGKSAGKDYKHKKFTYPVLYGIEGSRKIAQEKTDEAVGALDLFGAQAVELKEIAVAALNREK